ncbi:hypothetical protein [Streptomyces otsuchiensis]|uniref:hypothetical protein n=1 Tax=Streptomyces otsuchiensis TaxID=2681388 RepID=UPI00102FF78B|nr:hypothetical protein [Streptomyces otsuchiensis]
MRRQLMIVAVWVGATGAAVTLTWFGVGSVIRGTAYDAPRALAVTGAPSASESAPEPDASSTQRPPPATTEAGDREHVGEDGNGGEPPRRSPAPAGSAEDGEPPGETGPPPGEAGDSPGDGGDGDSGLGTVETVSTDGGLVAFDMGPDSAELVSATPAAGWEMQVWTEEGFIRVTFSGHGRAVSVFCVFNGHAPYIDHHEE